MIGKIKTMVDDHKNRKKHRMICKQLGRDLGDDLSDYSKCTVDLRIDKDLDYNQVVINDSIVAQGSFRELAMLYHFLKKCVYR